MRTSKLWLMGLLGISLSVASTGCLGTRTKVIDPNTTPIRMPAAKPYTPPCDGYFIPDATMLRVLNQVSEKDVFGK